MKMTTNDCVYRDETGEKLWEINGEILDKFIKAVKWAREAYPMLGLRCAMTHVKGLPEKPL